MTQLDFDKDPNTYKEWNGRAFWGLNIELVVCGCTDASYPLRCRQNLGSIGFDADRANTKI